MKETTIERKLRQNVEKRHGKCIKLASVTGIPDRLVLLPGGRIFFIETKRPSGATSERQDHVIGQLDAMGFDALVLASAAEVDEFLRIIDSRGHNLNTTR